MTSFDEHTQSKESLDDNRGQNHSSSIEQSSSQFSQSAQSQSEALEQQPSILAMAQEALNVSRSFFDLASLETREAFRSLPKVLGLLFLAIVLAVLAWLALSSGIGWLAYIFLGSAGWAIFAFLLVQIVSILICKTLITKYVRVLGLPNTRQFMQNFRGVDS